MVVDVVNNFFDSSILLVLSASVSIITLGTGFYKGIHWLNEQNEKKVAQKKIEDESKANEVKNMTESKAKELREYYDKKNCEMINRLDLLDTNVSRLVDHSSFTNGNVENIRLDTVELREDISEIFKILTRGKRGFEEQRRRTEEERKRKRIEIRDEADRQSKKYYTGIGAINNNNNNDDHSSIDNNNNNSMRNIPRRKLE